MFGSTVEGLGVDIRMNSTRVGNCVCLLLLLKGANVGDSLDWKLGGSVGDMITDGLELEAKLGTSLGWTMEGWTLEENRWLMVVLMARCSKLKWGPSLELQKLVQLLVLL